MALAPAHRLADIGAHGSGERRAGLLRELAERIAPARSEEEAFTIAAETLALANQDAAFALLYLVREDGLHADLVATSGSAPGTREVPAVVDLAASGEPAEPARSNVELSRLREEVVRAAGREEALREREHRLGEAQRIAHVGHWERDLRADRIAWSDETYRIFGMAPREHGMSLADLAELVHPEDRQAMIASIDAALAGGSRYDLEYRVMRPGGEERIVHSQGDVSWEGSRARRMFGTVQDITERRRTEEQLRASLREKDVLLREVHHRVKNNLQFVNSLLALQAAQLKDRAAIGALTESQHRLRAMALVHERLYRSPDLTSIRLADHVEALCAYLYRSYGVDSEHIPLDLFVADAALDLDRSIRCGLIINELVSNAVKHAFPGGRSGRIRVRLDAPPGGCYRLVVADNGVGLPPGLEPTRSETLGLQLVGDLTEQLGGILSVDRRGGTTFCLRFPADAGALHDTGQDPHR